MEEGHCGWHLLTNKCHNWSHGSFFLPVDGQFPDNSPKGAEIWLQEKSAYLCDIQLELYKEEGHIQITI